MKNFFQIVEPASAEETLARYWHYLRGISEDERRVLGAIQVTLASQVAIRGWPISLKNHCLAISSEADLGPKTSVTFVEVSLVHSVTFSEAHKLASFITNGTLSRSPIVSKPNREDAERHLRVVCEELRRRWPVKIFFNIDPRAMEIDHLLNMYDVIMATSRVIDSLRVNETTLSDLMRIKNLHLNQSDESLDLSVSRPAENEMEITFNFKRALPSALFDRVHSMIASQVE